MSDEVRILLVEDSDVDAELIEREIRRAGIVFRSRRVETKESFVSALQDFDPELVLSDNSLPAFDALSALSLTRHARSDAAFIVVSGAVGEELGVEMVKSGVTDYVLKHHLFLLGPAIHRALAEAAQRRESHKMEESARAANERFRNAFENAPAGMALMGLDGHLLQVNRALCSLLGRTEPNLLLSTVGPLILPEDRAKAEGVFERLVAGEPPGGAVEQRFVHADGHVVWVLLATSALAGPDGRAECLVGQFVDITATKDAEARRDLFLSHVSHELRAPLSVVLMFASLLFDEVDGPLSTDQLDLLTVLIRNAGQLRVMIDDLLLVTQAENGRLVVECQAMAMGDVVIEAAAAVRPTAERRGMVLQVDVGGLPIVVADADRLRAVLANLLDNALKYTPDGGQITVEATAQGDTVRVAVRDTGCGLRPEDESHVFEQFFQANQGDEQCRNGLGLGLFICRDLIERQGGDIWVASKLGKGTEVAFTIPILKDILVRT